MQRRPPFALLYSLVLLLAVGACTGAPAADSAQPATAETAAPAIDLVARGEYLVSAAGCDDCHTPKVMGEMGPEPDMTRRLSGHPTGPVEELPVLPEGWLAATDGNMTAWAGPWGISYAANLTPDEMTGLEVWTEEMFLTAIREGKHMGTSRPILPPMPWQVIRNFNDEDLRAIFAFLQSLPPIENEVPLPTPPAAMQ
jgi:cytochrome c553